MATTIPGNVIIFDVAFTSHIKLTLTCFRIATAVPGSYPKVRLLVNFGNDFEFVVGAIEAVNLTSTVVHFITDGQMVSS